MKPSSEPPLPMAVVDLVCQDGVRLKGHFFLAHGGTQRATEKPVLVCPATGVKQHFYLRFAEWLARQGHDVLVFDYRGVGMSLNEDLKNCRAMLAEWGQQDQVAALAWLLQRTGQEKALLIGHSAGGQMLGLLPNHRRVERLVGVASSSGWFAGMRPGYRFIARSVLCGLIPLGVRLKGYAPCSKVGLGEDLPAAVALQWGRWCSAGGYATNAVRENPSQDFHGEIAIPITVFHATDDRIATPATVGDLMRTFPQARKAVHRIAPGDYGLKAIGHIDWFRSSHQALWPLLAKALRGEA